MNDDDIDRLKRKILVEREVKYNDSSRDRLKKIADQKIRTTMIGALSAIEKEFGFLWEDGDNASTMKEIFDRTRSQILDLGNNQIRTFDTEIEQYEVKWNRYHLDLPVRPGGKND
jgi:hypothetical protein